MPPPASARRLIALEAGFVVLWSSGFIGAKYGLPYAETFTLHFWRYALLTGLMGVALALRGGLVRPGRAELTRVAVVGVLAHAVWLSAAVLPLELGVPAGTVAVVTALQPMLTGALAGPVLGERVPLRQWGGLLLGFVGVAVIVGPHVVLSPQGAPYLIPFVAPLAMTAANLYQRAAAYSAQPARLGVVEQLFLQCAVSALALAPLGAARSSLAVDWQPAFLLALAWLAVVVSLGAYALMWLLLRHARATRVASLMYLSPPTTMVMAWLAFGETLTLRDVAGLLIAATGVWLVTRRG